MHERTKCTRAGAAPVNRGAADLCFRQRWGGGLRLALAEKTMPLQVDLRGAARLSAKPIQIRTRAQTSARYSRDCCGIYDLKNCLGVVRERAAALCSCAPDARITKTISLYDVLCAHNALVIKYSPHRNCVYWPCVRVCGCGCGCGWFILFHIGAPAHRESAKYT